MDGNTAREQPEWNFEMRTQSDEAHPAWLERPCICIPNGVECDPTCKCPDHFSPDYLARAASQERPQSDIGEAQASEFQVGYAAGVRAASQERPPIDVEQIVRAALRVVDQETPLSVGEPLIQKAIRYATNLSRLSGSVGE